MAFQLSEVDGVPVIVAPSAGQTTAGLVFRVGRGDETLARSGITHLTEHLLLHPLGLTDIHFNGSTGPEVTSFHTSGRPDEVVAFFAQVCAALAALPMQRLETERDIIRTEWSSRSTSVYEALPLWRYGARTRGLVSYHEPGIRALTPADLEQWTRTWFTRENAVLWVAGEIPPGLRLPLPGGRRMPLPQPTSALPATPAWFVNGPPAVVMDAVVPHSPPAAVFAEVLERALFHDLRQEGGLSYAVSTNYDDRGDGWATITAGADAHAEKADAVLGGFVDTLARLRVGRIEERDITSYTAKLRERARHPDAEASTLASAAFELLTGRAPRDLAQRLDDMEAVTVAQVHAVARAAVDGALLGVPGGRDADWAGFTAAPHHSTSVVAGAPHRSRESDRRLHIGPEGISVAEAVAGQGPRAATVRFDEVAAMTAWPDGARHLIGYDGITVRYEPTLWHATPAITAQLDAAVPPDRVITLPARSPEEIPQPDQDGRAGSRRRERSGGGGRPGGSGPTGGERAGGGRRWSGGELTGLILSLVLGSMLLCLGGLLAVATTQNTGSPDDIGWGPAISTFVCMAVVFAPAVWLLLRRRR